MDFVDYIEKVCDIKLFEYQKQFLRAYDKAQQEGKQLIFIPARGGSNRFLLLIGLYHLIKEQGGYDG